MLKNNLFYDDNSVVHSDTILRIPKACLLILVLFIGFDLSDYGISNIWMTFASSAIVLSSLIFFNFFGFRFWNIRKINTLDIIIVLLGYVCISGCDFLFELLYKEPSINDENIHNEYRNASFILILLNLAILPAIVEELVMRGLIMRVIFKDHLLIGLIVSSLIFAYLHDGGYWIDYIPYFYFGIIVGILYLFTKKIEVAIMIHFLNNFVNILFPF